MRYLAYNVRYSVVTINSTQLVITLHSSVKTKFLCRETKYSWCYKCVRLFV